jgi:hypothetical protein
LIIDALLPLVGVVLGWGLKSLADYLVFRRGDIRTYNKATFFILRAWKLLKDYDRGTDHFRKKKPEIQQFEPWRAILAQRFIENFSANADTVSQAVSVLSEADPALATRLDNTIRNILYTFRANLTEISTRDAKRYAQLIYNQDYIVDLTLHDLAAVANKLAARSGVLQQIRVRWYFRKIKAGTKEFEEGMNEQAEMINKVINP